MGRAAICAITPLRLIDRFHRCVLNTRPVFNVAVPFIDRHLDEARGDKVAIRADAGDVTYRALAENVNRCGNALRELGLVPGDRVLMVVKDCAEFFYTFWGAIKAGFRARAVEHAAARA